MFPRYGPLRGVPRPNFWWLGFGHVLATIAVLALIVVLAVWLTNRTRTHHAASVMMPPPPSAAPMPTVATAPPVDPAITETRLRYARGEISREDFLRITEDLGGGPAAGA